MLSIVFPANAHLGSSPCLDRAGSGWVGLVGSAGVGSGWIGLGRVVGLGGGAGGGGGGGGGVGPWAVWIFLICIAHTTRLCIANRTRLRSKPSIQVSYARTYAERITFKHAPELSSTVPGARHSVLARFPFPFPFSTSLMCSVNFLLRSIGFALWHGGASLGL